MSSGTGRWRAAVALAAPAVFALALPAAADLHDHPDRPDRPDRECRICEVSTAQAAVVRDGDTLPARTDETRRGFAETRCEIAPPVLRSGAARAPPA